MPPFQTAKIVIDPISITQLVVTKVTSVMALKLVTTEIYFLWQNNTNTSCSYSTYTKLLGQSKFATAQLKNDTKGKMSLHLVSGLMCTILRMLCIFKSDTCFVHKYTFLKNWSLNEKVTFKSIWPQWRILFSCMYSLLI